MRYAITLRGLKAQCKLQTVKQRKPSKMKAALSFEETKALTSPRTPHWPQENSCPVLIHVCFPELPQSAPYSGEPGLSAHKVNRMLKRTSKTPQSMQPRALQNRGEPIRTTPRHMHAWIQVKTIFLHEPSSCSPAKPSPGEHIWGWNAGLGMLLTKKQAQIKQRTG